MSSELEKHNSKEEINLVGAEAVKGLKRETGDSVDHILFTPGDDRRSGYGYDGQFRPSVLFTAESVQELNWEAYYGPEFAIKR